MSQEFNLKNTAKITVKKSSRADIKAIIDDTPLFAGLDDYILSQAKLKKAETAKAIKANKVKKAVKPLKKQSTPSRTKPQQAAKTKLQQPIDPDAILLSVNEMCKLLKISRATLVRMDKSGKLPGRIKMGGSVRFHRKTVDNWLQSLINHEPLNPEQVKIE